MKRIAIILLVLILLTVSLTLLKLFVIGEPADADMLSVHVEESDGQVTIYIQTMDSAAALSDIQFRYEDTVLHLTVRKVLTSPLHASGEKCLYYEITDEAEIWLGNKLIWSRQ